MIQGMTRIRQAASLLTLIAVMSALSATACGLSNTPVVFTSDRDGNLEVYSVDPGSENTVNLTNSLDDQFAPVLSPDRKLVAFRSGSGTEIAIETMTVNPTSRTRVTPGLGDHWSQRWSPESDRIIYIEDLKTERAVYVSSIAGLDRILLTRIPLDEIGDWSQDGDAVLLVVRSGSGQGIYVRNPDGVNEFRITDTPDYGPTWSPDSRKVAFLSTRDGNPEVYVMNADGTDQRRLTDTDAPEYHLSWSPNGKYLLFVSERDGNSDIYIADPYGTGQTRLTFNSVRDEQPVWSPNGDRIAFVSYLDGDAEIFVMDSDGKNQARLTNNNAQDTDPAW